MKKSIKSLFQEKELIRTIGVYGGLSAKLSAQKGFDALWASGLCISASHCLPDNSILTMTEFLQAAMEINKASNLPVIADCDTGYGDINNALRTAYEYENAGISAICLEDKLYPKKNSFSHINQLMDAKEFALKLRLIKMHQMDPDFFVIARIESFVAGLGLDDAIYRSNLYCDIGKADAILIHSKSIDGVEIEEFMEKWRKENRETPVVVIPTSFCTWTSKNLNSLGIKMVIYANQILRGSLRTTQLIMDAINNNDSTASIEKEIMSMEEILEIIGTKKVEETIKWYNRNLSKSIKQLQNI